MLRNFLKIIMLRSEIHFIDLKPSRSFCENFASQTGEVIDERRTNGVFPIDGACPHRRFQELRRRYDGHYKVQNFSCWDQYLAMAFAQLTYREGLRDIEACLKSQQQKLYHMGFWSRVCRSTLADANEIRN